MYYWSDIFYVLTLILFVVSLICSGIVKSRFKTYSKEPTRSGMTGAMAAERILRANGIGDVTIVQTRGTLTDNYNPTNHTLNLSAMRSSMPRPIRCSCCARLWSRSATSVPWARTSRSCWASSCPAAD